MKALKYLLIAVALVSPFALQAQQEKPKGQGNAMRGDRIKMMTEQLDLTTEQVAKIRPIVAEEMKAMAALRDDTALSQEDRRAKMREIRQTYAPQIRAVLTPEQQAKFDSMAPGGKGKGKKEKN